jgi:hypothetical protein
VLAAAAFGGGAYAATQTTSDPQQAFLNDVAKRLNVTPTQLTAALKGASIDQLQAAVAGHKLTQAQADALKQRIEQGKGLGPALGLIGGPGVFGGPRHGPGGRGFGPRGPGGPRALGGPRLFGGPRFGLGGAQMPAAAKYLGLSSSQLAADLRSGKTLAQIASSRGKSVSGLKDAMVAAQRTRLQKLVSDKVITSAQEQKLLGAISSRLDAQINGRTPRMMLRSFRFRPGTLHRPGMAPPAPPHAPSAPAPGSYPVAPSPPTGPIS